MKNEVTFITRKTFKIRESGRSTDFISPSFGHGCLYNCTYCYMKRHKFKDLNIAKNVGDILTHINNHAYFTPIDKPNQTHESLTTYDISCNEDFALHIKYHKWERIFDFFRDHDIAMGSFATKFVNKKLLSYDPKGKIRIRFSMMPQKWADKLEPQTSPVIDRIKAINDFIEAGYDVHINFSPVLFISEWLKEYEKLFSLINKHVRDEFKNKVKAEVIFLTHNSKKHEYNILNNLPGEDMLWTPRYQEEKQSEYGGINIRYERDLKKQLIDEWTILHNRIIPWNTIRYIF